MTAWKEYYSHHFDDDWFGFVSGTASAQNFPSGTARVARFRADPSNQGNVLIGRNDQVIFPLDAGDDTGWFSVSQGKLQNYQLQGDGNCVYFWVQR